MKTLENLELEHKWLKQERLVILRDVDNLSRIKAPVEAFRECGEKLTVNLNYLRGVRYDINSLKAQQLKNPIKMKKKAGKIMTTFPAKSVEAYHDLKAQGLTDTQIRIQWVMNNSSFYKWKSEVGLVKPYGKTKDVKKTEELKRLNKLRKKANITESEEPVIPEVELAPVSSTHSEVESIVAELRETMEALRKENEQLKSELWSDRIRRLYALQFKLDKLISETQGVKIEDHSDEQLLALLVELAEAVNEEKSFKYWKVDKKVNNQLLVLELADVLHFILSRGLMYGLDKRIDVQFIKRETVTKQFLAMFAVAGMLEAADPDIVALKHTELLALFISLVEMLGYSWAEMEDAYVEKNGINTQRQFEKY